MQTQIRSLGIDIGSTTAKLVLLEDRKVIFERYERHYSRIRETLMNMLHDMASLLQEKPFTVAISGSAGLGIAEDAGVFFAQEVYATAACVRALAPDTGVVIELGGEDAKVIFFQGGVDERMNGTCAGGTGAFIDQMAVLLNMTVAEMDDASLHAGRIYPIASRCGVFAKSDIQPLLNQGANKADVAASIYQAVVNQTITGLIQGREISGKVMFLGGPLHYCKGLRKRFAETLKLDEQTAIFPTYDRFTVALGAAMLSEKTTPMDCASLLSRMEKSTAGTHGGTNRLPPLFANREDYLAFCRRHGESSVPETSLSDYCGKAWLGIDCGSTTTKMTLIAQDKSILYSFYSSNKGNPVSLVREQLMRLYSLCGSRVTICGSAVTGYGEDLIRHAFHVDAGLVETLAHYTAARHFRPDVDFILDIGGQDIKCFRIRNGAIDSIMLNEACSSGCGSFIETFARSAGYDVADFAKLGLLSAGPVNLGSRCTVFMNSSVKQAQKDGASVEDIAAGLSVSVVKNAIYKVIRATSPKELGEHIVVQGGTFYNDAVLRAFEMELGTEVIRPNIAGLMGAYGAALYAMRYAKSSLLDADSLAHFTHTATSAVCGGCANHCHLTVNRFGTGEKFISGNQCEKGAGIRETEDLPNVQQFKRDYLTSLMPGSDKRGKIGLPLTLGMYELAPLWHAMLTSLGFEVHLSGLSTRQTYEKGQLTIPSDTVCYPAKIMHGHMLTLLEAGIDNIFYPALTYNVNEGAGDNHFNCPVVAYYGEVLGGNMPQLKKANFMNPYVCVDNARSIARGMYPCLHALDESITPREVRYAAQKGLDAYHAYHEQVKEAGRKAIAQARAMGKRIMVLAGRPYHIDPEIGHGIDKLAGSLGFVVVTEDSIAESAPVQKVKVLDQWTFHARLYRAAAFAAQNPDVELVQMVSFGCGIDAITTDEVRAMLEKAGKHYTQLKIDEITNLGAVRIRLRSLLGALEEAEEKHA